MDIKIQLIRQDADRLLALLSPSYSMLVPDPGGALREQAMLFIQDRLSTRLDLLADTPYDEAAIKRSREFEIEPETNIRLCIPEDLIIYKLISTRLRDHEDADSVVKRQGDALVDRYVIGWLEKFEKALDDSTLVAEYQ